MKAVLQAGWLFTVAVGNFIVLIVAELAEFPEQVKTEGAAASARKKKKQNTRMFQSKRVHVVLC